jgi:hypothetical protein
LREDYLDGVSCVAAGSCTAVGFYVPHKNGIDVPLVERWNGTSWTKAEQVRDNNRWAGVQLFGVSCVSASDCMVVGVYSPMAETQYSLAESWNGTDWTITPTPPAPGALASFLTGVSCTSDGDCMTVGSYSASSAGPLVGLSESWRGSSWSLETVPGPAGADSSGLGSVSCISGTSCVGVGDSNGYGATLAESWNGENWAIESTPDPAGSPNVTLSSTSCVAGWCSAVGEYAPSTSSSDYLPFAADT